MDGAHLHLLVNHFPVIGTVISLAVLLTGMIVKNDTVKKTALAITIFTAALTVPTFLSGDDAIEALKAINQAPTELIRDHEEMGDIGIWTMIVTGLLAVMSFVKIKARSGKIWLMITLLALISNAIFMAKISNAGGLIRHTEVRSESEK